MQRKPQFWDPRTAHRCEPQHPIAPSRSECRFSALKQKFFVFCWGCTLAYPLLLVLSRLQNGLCTQFIQLHSILILKLLSGRWKVFFVRKRSVPHCVDEQIDLGLAETAFAAGRVDGCFLAVSTKAILKLSEIQRVKPNTTEALTECVPGSSYQADRFGSEGIVRIQEILTD